MVPSNLMILQQADAAPVTVVQALLLLIALLLVFPVSIGATGFMAKKIFDTDEVYIEALWATVFKNVGFLVVAALLGGALGLPPEFALIIAGVGLPIVIYKIVSSSTVAQASLIFIGVIVVELVVGSALVAGALLAGSWLDSNYDFATLGGTVLAGKHQIQQSIGGAAGDSLPPLPRRALIGKG
jgi:hypothetical protein